MLGMKHGSPAGLQRSAIAVISLALVSVIVFGLVLIAPAQADSTSFADPSASVSQTQSADTSTTSATGQDASTRTGKWIEIVLSRQMLYAWQNGRVVMSSAISSGVAAHPTLRGTFHIYVKYRSTRMRGPGYNLPNVPYTMYYSGSYGIHGAYWHHNFGHPMSHGCINLPVSFSRQLFYWASVGTLVVIH